MSNSFTATLNRVGSRSGYIRQQCKLQRHTITSWSYMVSINRMACQALTIPLCTMLSGTTWLTQLQDNMKQKRTNQQHGPFNSNHHANIYSTILSEQQTGIKPLRHKAPFCSAVAGCVHKNFAKLAQKAAQICSRNPKATDEIACNLAAMSTLLVTSICNCLFSIGRQPHISAFTLPIVQNEAHSHACLIGRLLPTSFPTSVALEGQARPWQSHDWMASLACLICQLSWLHCWEELQWCLGPPGISSPHC